MKITPPLSRVSLCNPTRAKHALVSSLFCLMAALPSVYAGSLVLGDNSGNTPGTNAIDIQTARASGQGWQAATGGSAIAFGSLNSAGGLFSMALGYQNESTNDYSISLGSGNVVDGLGTAFGYFNTINYAADAYNVDAPSGVLGMSNYVGGYGGYAIGIANSLSSNYGGAFGSYNTISASNASIYGSNITNSIANSVMVGPSDSAKVTILPSGNVGIGGTADPQKALTLYSSIGNQNTTGVERTYSTLGFQVSTTGYVPATISAVQPPTYYQDAADLTFTTGAGMANVAERLRIKASGNVGIGTSAPAEKLEVVGNIKLSGYLSTPNGNLTLPAGSATLLTNNGTQSVTGATTLQGTTTVGGSSAAQQVKIDGTTGNMGIGATAPSAAKLQVAGDSIFGVAGTAQGANSVTFRSDSAAANVDLFNLNFQRSYYSPTGTAAAIVFGREAGAAEGNLSFRTNNGSSLSERLRITADGNVGIGTLPAAKLHVNTATSLTSGSITGTRSEAMINSSASTTSAIGVLGQGMLYPSATGNNSSPGSVIGVQGVGRNDNATYSVENANGVTGVIWQLGTGSITNGRALTAGSPAVATSGSIGIATGLYIADQKISGVTTGYGVYQTGTGDLNYFAGNMGIGTAASAQKLAVAGTVRVINSSNAAKYVDIYTDTNGYLSLGNTVLNGTLGTGSGYYNIHSFGPLVSTASGYFFSNNTNAVSGSQDTGLYRLSAGKVAVGNATVGDSGGTLVAGNVGVGTTSPAAKLHISSTGSSSDRGLRIQTTGTGTDSYAEAQFVTTAREYRIGVGGSGADSSVGLANKFYLWDTQAGARMVVDPSGNIGIGTTSPSSANFGIGSNKLDVVGASGTSIAVQSSAYYASFTAAGATEADLSLRDMGATTGNQVWNLVSNDGALSFRRLGDGYTPVLSTPMVIAASGNIGIGTTAPSAKLEVNGDAKVSGSLTVGGAAVLTATGDGSGLTALNATQLTTGTLPPARLPSEAVQLTSTQTLTSKTLAGAKLTGTTVLGGSDEFSQLRVTSSGKVTIGVGDGSPSYYTLDVAGGVHFNDWLVAEASVSVPNGYVDAQDVYTSHIGLGSNGNIVNYPGTSGQPEQTWVIAEGDSELVLQSSVVKVLSEQVMLGAYPGHEVTINASPRNGSAQDMDLALHPAGDGHVVIGGKTELAGDVTVKNVGSTKSVIRISPAGDIDMGDFRSGTNPNP